ncbi:GWT1-domain-containing protein [Lipomyces japonicus]|uniref:GWT1-domain-containing protein n=1 Tax=Lipomyces japonicus TaxID=56871 RepID=UPI0034CD4572
MPFSYSSPEITADRTFKHLKEEFVSGLTGGSIQEINVITLAGLTSYSLWCAFQTRFAFFSSQNGAKSFSFTIFTADFILNWVLLLLSITIYASHPLSFNLLILTPAIIICTCFPVYSYTKQKAALTIIQKREKRLRSAHDLNSISTFDEALQYDASLDKKYQDEQVLQSSKEEFAPSTSPFLPQNSHSIPSAVSTSAISVTPISVEAYLPKKSFLTTYRGGMMIITCIAILSVDFEIFPRRFAKVETWGTSLMDLGVGSFVFSMGLVSARGYLKDEFLKQRPKLLVSLIRSFRQTTSVLILGGLRLLLVKAVDYHEHTSEYGVHWNFFMTLGLLPPFLTLFNFLTDHVSHAMLSLFIGTGYQLLLHFTPLLTYILTAPRTGIISQNKEGIFSFIGYLSIFLAGQSTGLYTLPSVPRNFSIPFLSRFACTSKNNSNGGSRKSIVIYLSVSGIGYFALFQICTHLFSIQVSRRLANLPYVLWIASYNNIYILLYFLVETFFFHSRRDVTYEDTVPRGVDAVNVNGLAIFLLANVLTGLVNLTVNTLKVKNVQALSLLIGYCAVLSAISWFIKSRQWRLKI